MIGSDQVVDVKASTSFPDGWRLARLGEVCEINPRRPSLNRLADAPTTFVPMSAVEEAGRGISHPECKTFSEVRSGYTYFSEGDVLFAKITPCMQNGKHAVARDLISGIGFGSTEFHVIRPKAEVLPEWVHLFIIQPWVLQRAEVYFTGSVGQQRIPQSYLETLYIPLPSLVEQQRIITILTKQIAYVDQARIAAETQLELLVNLIEAYLRQSLLLRPLQRVKLSECLEEVSKGVGEGWRNYPVVGATRAGLAPAKESIGKNPGRYKLVDVGTIFYNPMRILIGSIAMIDDDDEAGITSPDYVVFNTQSGVLHSRWFYYWLRSSAGRAFIKTLARGAVRERMLYKRLASAEIGLPPWDVQLEAVGKLKLIAKMKRSIEQQLSIINQLPAVLLEHAFNGEPH